MPKIILLSDVPENLPPATDTRTIWVNDILDRVRERGKRVDVEKLAKWLAEDYEGLYLWDDLSKSYQSEWILLAKNIAQLIESGQALTDK